MKNKQKDGQTLSTAKIDNRPKLGWWAPGEYFNKCRICDLFFIGDKRAGHCADCAYENNFINYDI